MFGAVYGNKNRVFRQTTGPCGEPADESELLSWAASYNGTTDDAEDDPPTVGDSGRYRVRYFLTVKFDRKYVFSASLIGA